LENLISKNYYLHQSAKEGYKSYVRSYASHSHKQIFDVETLDLQKVALSFGFKVPPFVDLSILCVFYFYRASAQLAMHITCLSYCKGVCLSVRVSVSLCYRVKTTQAMIQKYSLLAAWRTLLPRLTRLLYV